ncbi:hypothetical protein D3C72_2198260 [compost metagenome]
MRRYLQEADPVEAMNVFYGPEVEPRQHKIWTGDFMGKAKHDIACPVCFDASAGLMRDVTPGRYSQNITPCRACERLGWRVVRLPKWLRWLIDRLSGRWWQE